MQRFSFVILIAIVVGACAPKATTTSSSSTTQSGRYSEDLSLFRPKDYVGVDTTKKQTSQTTTSVDPKKSTTNVEARFAVNQALDAVLDSIARINLANGLIDGFTIQVYSGTKREEALNAKKNLSVALPDLDADIQYVQPNFRVRIGKYYDRLNAQKDFMAIKKHFPNAIVIPERISIQ